MTTRDTVGLHHLLEGPEDAPVLVLSNSLGTNGPRRCGMSRRPR